MFFKVLIKVFCGLCINLTLLSILHLKDNVATIFQSHVQHLFVLIAVEKVAVLVNNRRKDFAVCHL